MGKFIMNGVPYGEGAQIYNNTYGAFIDTNRVIKPRTTYSGSSSVSYTAIEDCAVICEVANARNGGSTISIDGQHVGGVAYDESVSQINQTYFLKQGHTITLTSTFAEAAVGYTVYGLTFGTNNIFTPQIYSTTEREVGTWIDNKPLYQRTLIYNNITKGRVDNLPHNISNIDRIVYNDWVFANSQNHQSVTGFENTSNNYWAAIFAIDNNGISYRIGTDWSVDTLIVNVKYTKTTDTPGSAQYNTLGVPMVHYSTDEQIIGTYLGKPLYQRIITPIITANTTLAGDIKYGSFTLGDYINSVDMAFVDLSVSYIEPATGATRGLISAYYEKDSGNIVIVTMFTRANSPSSLCIKYTKITD